MNRERKKNRNDLIMRDNTIIILTLLLRSTVIRVVRYSVVKSLVFTQRTVSLLGNRCDSGGP